MLPRPAEEGCGCFADVLASAPRTGELIDAHGPAECRYLVFVGSEESDLCGFQEDLENHVLFFLHKLLQPIRRFGYDGFPMVSKVWQVDPDFFCGTFISLSSCRFGLKGPLNDSFGYPLWEAVVGREPPDGC